MTGGSNTGGGYAHGSGHSESTVNAVPPETSMLQLSIVSGKEELCETKVKKLRRHDTIQTIYDANKPPNALGLKSVSTSGHPIEVGDQAVRWVLLDTDCDPAETTLDELFQVGTIKRLKLDCEKAAPESPIITSGGGAAAGEFSFNQAAGVWRRRSMSSVSAFETITRSNAELKVPAEIEDPHNEKLKLHNAVLSVMSEQECTFAPAQLFSKGKLVVETLTEIFWNLSPFLENLNVVGRCRLTPG